jgi:CMP-N,N'-diacetyllegionaminic acid synthase
MRPEVLALIPARGGSKGVPHKNRRLVAGQPLIRYSIDSALAAHRLTQIAVTTDDSEIAAIAREAGVMVIDRPAAIAADQSPVIDAVRHALAVLGQRGLPKVDCMVLLQPTSPLRTGEDIDQAIDLYFVQDRNPVCSVYRCEDNHPARMYSIDGGRLKPLMPELDSVRRQDLPAVYHRNGALYVFGQREVESGRIISPLMTPYVMDQSLSLNVDTEFDLVVLEAMLSRP